VGRLLEGHGGSACETSDRREGTPQKDLLNDTIVPASETPHGASRSLYVSGEDLGRAMLRAAMEGMRGRIIENAEIREIAERA
jgi:hypothetical protein